LMFPNGRGFYHDEGHDITPRDVVDDGQYDPWTSCRAVSQACKRASECKWYKATPPTCSFLIQR